MINHNEPLLMCLTINKFADYLESTGWHRVNHPNKRIILFEGKQADNGEAIKVVIPKDESYEDLNLRLAEAINLLSVVENKSPYEIISRVLSINKQPTVIDLKNVNVDLDFLKPEKIIPVAA